MSASFDERVAAIFKAVADPTRVRILGTLLMAGELCVCHVEAALGVTQSRASRHLTTLKRAGLVVDRREGAWVHYSVPRRADPVVRSILQVVRNTMEGAPETRFLVARATAVRDGASCQGGGR